MSADRLEKLVDDIAQLDIPAKLTLAAQLYRHDRPKLALRVARMAAEQIELEELRGRKAGG